DTPLTEKLLTATLIDAETGELTASAPMPWYNKALALSQPLHFGDYGALPLKLLWAVLDIFTIIILGSGIYLWLGKRRVPLDQRVRELETGGTVVSAG
ncbi:MAG: PepSY domain-containing protein, partial [Sphingomonadales bacterium]